MKTLKSLFNRKHLWFYMLCIVLLFLLCNPTAAASGAKDGLLLWWERLVPCLLPFLIVTQLLLRSNALDIVLKKLHLTDYLFVLFAGLLFGFPMGAKLTMELYEKKRLNSAEAKILAVCANQMSPAFVGGYVMSEILGRPDLILPSYLILYGIPALLALLFYVGNTRAPKAHKPQKKTPGLQISFAILDASIMNSFETMLRLGGYVMLFSILQALCAQVFAFCPPMVTMLTALLEITGAIRGIHASLGNPRLEYMALLAVTAFGGCSGIAQTASFLQTDDPKTSLSTAAYVRGRILLAGLSAGLGAILYF
jgi:hypothetical protein